MSKNRPVFALLAAAALVSSGCLLAAAGAGAGGAVYVGDRGAESVVPASVDRAFGATKQAFQELNVIEKKTTTVEDEGERRELEGVVGDLDVKVTVKTQGDGAHVEVVARKSAVTWDKDFARNMLERIVALAGG
jgi:hypothetical protein